MNNRFDWSELLASAHIKRQEDVGIVDGLSKSQVSHLVKKMIDGEGKTATRLDKQRWKNILDYVDYRKNRILSEVE